MRKLIFSLLVFLTSCNRENYSKINKREVIFYKWAESKGIDSSSYNVSSLEDVIRKSIESGSEDFSADVIALLDLGYISALSYDVSLYDQVSKRTVSEIWNDPSLCKVYGVIALKYHEMGKSIIGDDDLRALNEYIDKVISDGGVVKDPWQFFLFGALKKEDLLFESVFTKDFFVNVDFDLYNLTEIICRLRDPGGDRLFQDMARYIFLDSDFSDNEILDDILNRGFRDELVKNSFCKFFVDSYFIYGQEGRVLINDLKHSRNFRSDFHRKVLLNFLEINE